MLISQLGAIGGVFGNRRGLVHKVNGLSLYMSSLNSVEFVEFLANASPSG